jgi:hypothetical protein
MPAAGQAFVLGIGLKSTHHRLGGATYPKDPQEHAFIGVQVREWA